MHVTDIFTDPALKQHGYSWNAPGLKDVAPMNCDAAALSVLDPNKTLEEGIIASEEATKALNASLPTCPQELIDQCDIVQTFIPGLNPDDPEIDVTFISKKGSTRRNKPVCIYGLGGGMVMSCRDGMMIEMTELAIDLDCLIVCPMYRLLPKWTYPAAVDDMEATFNYVVEHAKELNCSSKKIVAYGQSAGAYMSTCLAQRLKMRGGQQLVGELLLYPVIDDTFQFPSSKLIYGEVWQPIDDQFMFDALMGGQCFRGATPPDGVPIHCTDFKGMPPTVIWTGDLDYGHDAVIKYAQGIADAGIYCDLHMWGGAFHGFVGMCVGTPMYERASRQLHEALADLLTGDCVRVD